MCMCACVCAKNVYRVYAKGVRKICVREKCVPCVRERCTQDMCTVCTQKCVPCVRKNVYAKMCTVCTRTCVRKICVREVFAKLVLFWESPVSFAIWWWLELEFDWLSRFNMLCYLMNQIAFGISFKLRLCRCNPDEKLERI